MSDPFSIKGLYRAVMRDVTAGVTTIATLALPVVIGAAGLAFDLNRGYQVRMTNQRVADLAALGAAMAYREASDNSVLTPTARDIVLANGLNVDTGSGDPDGGAIVAATLVNNYPTAGEQSVLVTIDRDMPWSLASVLGMTGTFEVSVQAYAGLSDETLDIAAPCYLALSSAATAITISGGGSINAPNCTVAAIGGIYQGGSTITAANVVSGSGNIGVNYGSLVADSIRYAGSFSAPVWNTAVPPAADRVHEATVLLDPWANNVERVAAVGLLGNTDPIAALANPVTPASTANWNFNYSPAAPLNAWRVGTTAVYNVPAGNYTIRSLAVSGGITVNFASGSNITISNGFTNGGTAVNFGNANVSVNGGFASGSSGVTFGNGNVWIGSGTVSFAGSNRMGDGTMTINSTVTIGGGSSFTMGNGAHKFGRVVLGSGGLMKLGAGDFQATTGVNIAGSGELGMGAGNVLIGAFTDGKAIEMAGSARMFMGNGRFSADGNINTAGGSRLVFGATNNHYIDGNMVIAGSVIFGTGRYTIDGNFINGTGGTVWPYTSALMGVTYGGATHFSGYDMAGQDVTFVLNGTLNLAGGAKVRLEAPSNSIPGGGIGELLLTSSTTAATNWTAGANFVLSGAAHLPRSAVTMGGGNTTLSGTRCFSLIAWTITVSGGGATGTACTRMSNAVEGLSG